MAVLGSEEDEELIYTGNSAHYQYAVFFDPLDGSSNLDVAGGVGTIFSGSIPTSLIIRILQNNSLGAVRACRDDRNRRFA